MEGGAAQGQRRTLSVSEVLSSSPSTSTGKKKKIPGFQSFRNLLHRKVIRAILPTFPLSFANQETQTHLKCDSSYNFLVQIVKIRTFN